MSSEDGARPARLTMRFCCVSCNGVSLTVGGPEHTITDAAGRAWRFEEHHYCGPIVLRQDGEPKARQPGSRSPFWVAYDAWNKDRKAPDEDGKGQRGRS